MSISSSRDVAQKKFNDFCESRSLKDFSQIVQVVHQDGSIFVLHHASLWHSEETFEFDGLQRPKWVGVSTEHNGDHLFFSGDLLDWWSR